MSPAIIPTRSDGTQARLRLLRAALECFATHGYNKTSTRQIAHAAGVNLAAINYYFGSKAELYRAVYSQLCEIARDRKSTRLNSSHSDRSRMPSSA